MVTFKREIWKLTNTEVVVVDLHNDGTTKREFYKFDGKEDSDQLVETDLVYGKNGYNKICERDFIPKRFR